MDTLALRREVEKCKIEIDRDLEKISKLRKCGGTDKECHSVRMHIKKLNDKMQLNLEVLINEKMREY